MAAAAGEEPAHHVYASASEARATVPVNAASIPDFGEDRPKVSPDAVTDEVTAIPTTTPSDGAKPAAMGSSAASGAPSAGPSDANRIPLGVLRIIFGSLAALLALYLILVFIRRS